MPEPASADSTPATATRPDRRTRDAIAGLLDDFRDAESPPSQRLFAQGHDLPRSTLRHWLRRQGALDAPPEEVAFFESAAGVAFLHRLQVAAHLAFTQQGPCGLRLQGLFLRLARLDRFVAASYGAQQQFGRALEEQALAYEQAERPRLARQMTPKEVTACQDETFHPQVCLVAIEPVSNFLLLERYVARRDQQAWDDAMRQALEGLPVQVVQTVGDQAKALVAHAAHGLGVPKGTDLFHLEHDLCKALAPALARQSRSEEQRLARVQARTAALRADYAQAQARPKGPGRPPDYPGKVACAEQVEAEVARDVEAARQRQERLRAQLQGFSDADHPFDVQTGQAQSAEAVRRRLQGRLEALQGLAQEARLGPKAAQAVAGVGQALAGVVGVVAWFWQRVQAAGAGLPEPLRAVWQGRLLAAAYLKRVAGQLRGASRRAAVRALAEGLVAGLGPPAGVSGAEWEQARRLAGACAGWFVRTRSCVEGRNGQRSLRHHGLHRLSARKLGVLTVLHNYWLKRPDGTTAAERFFGGKPRDLFAWLLERLPPPARPARRRAKAA
jgi:hypothetical protein